jgi:membrane-bound serine protease (ClpP class)
MELTLATLVILGVALMILETVIPGWIAGILGGLCVLSAAAAVLLSDSFDTWPSWGRTLLAGGVVLFSVPS